MACGKYILKGLNTRCRVASFGGIKEIYIAQYDDVGEVLVDSGTTLVTPTMIAGHKFNIFSLARETASLSISMVYTTTMANYYVSTLNVTISKMDVSTRLELMALMNSQMAVIVKDSNDRYWYLGKDSYVEATVGAGNTGQALSDANSYSFSLTDTSLELPYEVDAACIPDITGEDSGTSSYLEAIYYELTGEVPTGFDNDEALTREILIIIHDMMDVATNEEISWIFNGFPPSENAEQ